ncbi:hypothetical protein GCM10010096_03140 [Alcaligenes pakistanensis]|uniref:Uncharacterized protein n=1 Tax=Alcaligenes pakistanensis TaxID=1482717 RepID=A0A8H9LZ30_9BURK|nr:hypothetical protein GCM10010096_03140 [Alcaligenes pakistanensis]
MDGGGKGIDMDEAAGLKPIKYNAPRMFRISHLHKPSAPLKPAKPRIGGASPRIGSKLA